jgi:hypothetical protein
MLIKKIGWSGKKMKSGKYSRRVHISPVGFEIDRVVLPLIEWEADSVWLLREKNFELDQGKRFFQEVKTEIQSKYSKCKINEKKCDFDGRDLYDILRAYRDIIQEEKNNQIFINVSTGTKIHSIAGMMACMIFKDFAHALTPYYVKPEKYPDLPKEGTQLSYGCKEILDLPNYKIEKPSDYLIAILKIINARLESEETSLTKKELIELLINANLLKLSKKPKTRSRNDKVAYYLALKRKCVDPLQSWKFIEPMVPGRRGNISITKEGKNILKFLG